MPIIIKKRVSLDFLGEPYKDSYIELRSMPLADYEQNETERAEIEKKQGKNANLKYMLAAIKKYFIAGKVLDQEIAEKDLDGFVDIDIGLACFNTLTGNLPPKAEISSTTPSSTEAPPQ